MFMEKFVQFTPMCPIPDVFIQLPEIDSVCIRSGGRVEKEWRK
jgi:hypothetical protein